MIERKHTVFRILYQNPGEPWKKDSRVFRVKSSANTATEKYKGRTVVITIRPRDRKRRQSAAAV